MAEVALFDAGARRVGSLIATAYREVLGDRLVALAAHGGAVTGFISGFSDFDFILVVKGFPSTADASALNEKLTRLCPDPAPFTYLQLSEVVDLAQPGGSLCGLIDGAYSLLAGALPDGWQFNSREDLRTSGRALLSDLPRLIRIDTVDWAADVAGRREHRVRVLFTRLKPAIRALLVERGLDPFEVWTANWTALPSLLEGVQPQIGSVLAGLVEALPPTRDNAFDLGDMALALIEQIAAMSVTGERRGSAGVSGQQARP